MMSSTEFTELLVAYEMTPWGDDWLQTALIAKLAGHSKASLDSLIPVIRKQQKTTRQMRAILTAAATPRG